jgi:sulfite reductase alpha subunit-like flavoprotein
MQHARHAPEKSIPVPAAYQITIAYGSETGTATRYAEAIKSRLEESSFAVGNEVIEMNELDLTKVSGTLIIVTCSYGDGVAPSTASTFLERLADPDTTIQNPQELKYAVFGLGNSTLYPDTYQEYPRQVDAALKKLGCRRIVPFGRGDDATDPEEGYQKWARTFMIAAEG